MTEAIIFDMDGILIDSEPVWDAARRQMATRLGKTWNKNDHEAVMGVSTAEWVDYMIKRLEPDMSSTAVQEEIAKNMRELYAERIPFMPHAIETVDLAKRFFRVGLASGSIRELVDIVTTSAELNGKFEQVLSADQVARGKPHPDVYLKTIELMGVSPKDCICIEDSGNGILAGKAAGMKVIAIPDARFPVKPEKLKEADVILESLSQINEELLRSF